MNIDLSAKIHNRFDIEVVDAETGKVKQRAQAFNVVCNSYFNTILSGGTAAFAGVQYGTGSGTPSASDVSLFAYSGYIALSNPAYSYDASSKVGRLTGTFQLGVSAAVGVTLTEVGCAKAAGNGNLVTHALLQDMNGNPISITKTNTDVINITATLFVHLHDYNGTNVLIESYQTTGGMTRWLFGNGSSHSFPILYLYGSRSASNAPGTTIRQTQSVPVSVHGDAANKKLTMTSRLEIDKGNVDGGIKYLHGYDYKAAGAGSDFYAGSISVPIGSGCDIEGYTVTGESVGTGDGSRTAFTLKFDCASALTVYLNGAATTAYTRSGRTITFNSAPAVGAVVTADYFSDTVPKDADHVFDLTVTMQFGEYTPE